MAETTDHLAALASERERIVTQLRELGAAVDMDDDGELDYDENFADSAQVTAERGEVDAITGTLRETLTEIDAAVAKIDAGTYGTCDNCGKEIGAARLDAMPMATLCVECASLAK
jgi:RNA polymerase-binding protein DksA